MRISNIQNKRNLIRAWFQSLSPNLTCRIEGFIEFALNKIHIRLTKLFLILTFSEAIVQVMNLLLANSIITTNPQYKIFLLNTILANSTAMKHCYEHFVTKEANK